VGACAKAVLKCQPALENDLRSRGYLAIAGADEVGRGSLFGPVTAAAVVLSPERPVRGLNDSKQLTRERREVLSERIRERAVSWAIASVDAAEIDRINIYQASRLAMKMAVLQLVPFPDYLLCDAVTLDLSLPQRGIIDGDAQCHAIAAASIIAKVHRDALMREFDQIYPQYGLARHKGYCCPEHFRALREHGATPLHRRSFEPVYRLDQFQLFTTPEFTA
jgi:ribonuclease HII